MAPGPSSNLDADLMSRLCGNDPLALAEIYDGHAKAIYSLLLYITRNTHTAEDLVQEVFLRLWSRRELFDASCGTLRRWLLSMARNIAIDHIRAGRRSGHEKLNSIEHAEMRHALPRADPTGLHIMKISISGALTSLRSCERAVIELAYFQGYSQTEIAGLLGQPLGTVKSWTRAGLKSLRVRIQATAKAA